MMRRSERGAFLLLEVYALNILVKVESTNACLSWLI
jgi:hypothetical protein